MATSPLSGYESYESKTFIYKTVDSIELKLDVLYPTSRSQSSPLNVLIHIHGGFLVVGDRYSFVPHWLISACVSRNWIFVTPDYRLLPETTAHSCVDDCLSAYSWVLETLPKELDVQIRDIMLAGSSAGGYLALTTTTQLPKPQRQRLKALLLIYGVLDATNERYTTDKSNIFNRGPINTAPTLKQLAEEKENGTARVLPGYDVPANATAESDYRLGLMSTFHQEHLYPDWMTGIDGLSREIKEKGPNAIPEQHRRLFATAFGLPKDMPPTALVHGRNDSAVPVVLSEIAVAELKKAGVEVRVELPEDAEHGFDARAGKISVEKDGLEEPWAKALRSCVEFLAEKVG